MMMTHARHPEQLAIVRPSPVFTLCGQQVGAEQIAPTLAASCLVCRAIVQSVVDALTESSTPTPS